ncbi:MAG: glycosyltransferase [Candidatus Aminicenantes bacterium]|nr:glycosyltransferase [Candidatus Aminicenantes bacterium]
MKTLIIALVVIINYLVGFYYVIINSIYSILLFSSLIGVIKHLKRIKYSAFKELLFSPEAPPVSILVPAYNESEVILRTVNSVLALRYPLYEVIIINDGSTDGTLEKLINYYHLRKIDYVYRPFIKTAPIRGLYYNPHLPHLVLVDKVKSGKADSLNCGLNISRFPYICTVDADSILESEALLRLMAQVVESVDPVIACGGVVRVLNGLKLKNASTLEIELPRKPIVLFQIVEYLRAFLFGRVGWDMANSILILSGTFSLFHRSAVLAAGGYNVRHVSEDMELVLKLHCWARENKKRYRIKFISDPVCWSEVPETWTMLGRQRRRWHLGLIQNLFDHRKMLFNPKYGHLGLVVMPYYLFFEMLGPIVELLGYIFVPLSFIFGLLSFKFFFLFLILAIFYGIFLSTTSIFLEEITYKRYPKWKHLFKLLIFGALENFGYRQINAFWRCQAWLRFLMGEKRWEYVEKKNNQNNCQLVTKLA